MKSTFNTKYLYLMLFRFVLDANYRDTGCIKGALKFLGERFWTFGTGLDFGSVSAAPERSSATPGFAARNGLSVL